MPETLLIGLWIILMAVFGLTIGSFLNVCIYRLPAGITIVRGRSFCPNCRHSLQAADLVPVLSYLLLGRRCRYCGEPISPRYARIELLTGFYFGLAAWFWRPGAGDALKLPPLYLAKLFSGFDTASLDSLTLLFGILLAVTAVFAFSGLLVWSVIFLDRHLPPKGVFLAIAIPVAIRLALQPERLPGHLIALALSVLFLLLLVIFRLLPVTGKDDVINMGAGLGLLALMAGLQAIQPVLAVFLIELFILAFYQNRGRENERIAKRAAQIWHSLPLQGVLLGSLLWLVF